MKTKFDKTSVVLALSAIPALTAFLNTNVAQADSQTRRRHVSHTPRIHFSSEWQGLWQCTLDGHPASIRITTNPLGTPLVMVDADPTDGTRFEMANLISTSAPMFPISIEKDHILAFSTPKNETDFFLVFSKNRQNPSERFASGFTRWHGTLFTLSCSNGAAPVVTPLPPPPPVVIPEPQSYYAWGTDAYGNDRCYPANGRGEAAAGSSPVDHSHCGSYFNFGNDAYGNGHCYPAKQNGKVLRGSTPVPLSYCGLYYGWGRDAYGNDRCYPSNREHKPLAGNAPVDYSYCR
jgi:hypothetical protein